MTSLSQQLKRLAVPQTSTVGLDFRRPSLLFDTKEAASIDRDTIYSIGLNGLEELELLDGSFEQFHSTLFSEASKKLERSIHSKEANEDLNKEIKKILLMLTPYMLLRPAHKAFEWLVNRYHVESYNIDEVVACILPYHDTNIFVRVVQLLDLRSAGSRWHWLLPIQKPGVPLAKTTLLTHCHKDLGFLKFICKFMSDSIALEKSKLIRTCRTVVSFYMTCVIGSIESANGVSEETISLLLPYLISGLKSGSADLISATYMIVCQISRKIPMDAQFLHDIIYQMLSNLDRALMKECISCLCALYQMQNIASFSSSCLQKLIEMEDEFLDALVQMSEKFYLGTFTKAFCNALVTDLFESISKDDKYRDKQKRICVVVQRIPLNDTDAVSFITQLVGDYLALIVETEDAEKKKKVKKQVVKIMSQVERRYPNAFDIALRKFSDRSEVKKLIQKMNVDPILNIHHSNVTIRRQATEQLVKLIRENEVENEDSTHDVILARLNDDDAEIVENILNLQEDLLRVIKEDILVEHLSKLVMKEVSADAKWNEILLSAVDLLVRLVDISSDIAVTAKIVVTLMPFTFYAFHGDYCFFPLFSATNKKKSSPLFNMLNPEIFTEVQRLNLDPSHTGAFNLKIFQNVQQWCDEAHYSLKEMMLKTMESAFESFNMLSSRKLIQAFFALHILPCLAHDSSHPNEFGLYSLALECIGRISKLKVVQKVDKMDLTEETLTRFQSKIFKHYIPYESICYSLSQILKKFGPTNNLKASMWWSSKCSDEVDREYLRVILRFFELTVSLLNKKTFSSNLSTFVFDELRLHLAENVNMLKLLSMIWIDMSTDQLKNEVSIELAFQWLKLSFQHGNSAKWIFDSTSCLIPMLLIGVKSKNELIRRRSLTCFSEISSLKSSSNSSFGNLVSYIVHHHEELVNDESFLPQMLQSFYSISSPSKRSKSKQNAIPELLHVICDPSVPASVKSVLLDCLTEINPLVILQNTQEFLNTLLNDIEKSTDFLCDEYVVCTKLLKCIYRPDIAPFFVDKSSPEYQSLKQALLIQNSPNGQISIQKVALEQITKDFFIALPNIEAQQMLFSDLLDLHVMNDNSDVASMIAHCLKKAPLNAVLVNTEITYALGENKLKKFSEARKKTKRSSLASESLSEEQEKRLVIMLETIQNKKKIINVEKLVPSLFNLLQRCLTSQMERSDYLQQLILSCVNHCCEKLDKIDDDNKSMTEEQFSIELVIECLRASKSSQTQQQALILLTHASQKFPDHVLHSVMTVFTFMGENIVRKDDSYSFQIINNTIETIIPIIIKHGEDSDSLAKISSVIQVFIDALPDIPVHRQLPLFKKLLTTLQPTQNFLYMALVLLFGHVVDKHEKRNVTMDTTDSLNISVVADASSGYRQSLAEFALQLCHEFSVDVQLFTCDKIILYLASLPEKKETQKSTKRFRDKQTKSTNFLFDWEGHSDKQLRHLKFQCVSFVSQLLSHDEFISQVVEVDHNLEEVYRMLIESTLNYIKTISQSVSKFHSDPTVKFWKVLLNKTYDVLDKVNGLLPSHMFVSVITNLMSSSTISVKRKAMEILNTKLQHQPDFFDEHEGSLLVKLVPSMLDVISSHPEGADDAINLQTALYSLKLLTRIVGHQDKTLFSKVLGSVLELTKKETLPIAVQASSLLCIAELASCLGPHIIAPLPKIMPSVIAALHQQKSGIKSEPLLLSALIVVQKLLEHLSNFLSPYLQAIISAVAFLSADHAQSEESSDRHSKSQVHMRLQTVRTLISTLVSPRILLPALEEGYHTIAIENKEGIQGLMSILSERIESMDKLEVSENFNLLEKLYLSAIKFRCENRQMSLSDLTKFEGFVIDSFATFVLKLSETTFRPLFFKLFNWATQAENGIEEVVTFYRLTDRIVDTLKGLFVLFAGNIVKHASKTLVENTSDADSTKNHDELSIVKMEMLLKFLLDTLHKCFLYDHEGFINKERFETLMKPLVNQLENFLGGDDSYIERINKHVCPCIAQFAVAVGDDISWKQLNYQVLLKTRHYSPKVRCAALQCTLEVCKKLGENFSSLLPETVPFLAELMEDESFEVEQKCQEVISEMEQLLGESLQSYF